MRNIKRAIKAIFLSSIISITLTVPIFATSNNNLTINIERYNPEGGWRPGLSKDFEISLNNNTNKNIKVDKISIYRKSRENNSLEKALDEMEKHTKVNFKYKGELISKSNSSLKDIISKNGIVLEKQINLIGNKEDTIIMEILMEKEMGNVAQLVSSVYSFDIGYKIIDNGGSGGGGTVTPPESEDKPENPDNPGGSEDTEKPEDPDNPGGSEDADKPENPNNPGGSEDTNNPNKPGGSEDTNKPLKPNKPGSNIGGSANRLPQTGGVVNSSILTILGLSVAGVGIALDRKSSSKKGGKIDG
ncbi:LPXTG cell wall anchor domain-containing protein [Faecalimicrobium sp. JNUCC 81]